MHNFLKRYRRAFILMCPALIIVILAVHLVYLGQFNSREYQVNGADADEKTYMDIDERADSTSVWYKRDFDMNGEIIDLRGQTVDGVLYNNSTDTVGSWGLKLNIKDDCYINNAWCGTVLIHQNMGTDKEVTQELDLRNYQLDQIKLDHVYDGDLLIPLKEGDQVEYFPSVEDSEYPVGGGSEMTIGMIFYSADDSDIFDYTLTYSYHRTALQGIAFYVSALLLILWLIILLYDVAAKRIYESAQRELELRKSGISSMSDMYDMIFIINLLRNEIVSVETGKDQEKKLSSFMGADEQIRNLFQDDAEDPFGELVTEFTDISSLRERMEGKKRITCEYVSKKRGWCRLNFFAMDYVEGRAVDRVVFTLQIIEDEKQEKDAIQRKISRAEMEKRELGGYFEVLSTEVICMTNRILELDQKMLEASQDPLVQECAGESGRMACQYRKLLEDIVEYSDPSKKEQNWDEEEYSFAEILSYAEEKLNGVIDGSKIRLIKKCPQGLPDRLTGNGARLKQIMETLMLNAAIDLVSGDITVSVFANLQEDKAHILISFTTEGEKLDMESHKLRMKLVDRILRQMGSQLRLIDLGDGREEVYFEIDQTVRADR